MPDPSGLISRRSRHDTPETTRRFRAAAEQAGHTIFADIDHGRNAVDAGLPLRPTRLLNFGNPRGGTPLMQLNQTAGIDLPLKALIWDDEAGATWLTYDDPQWIAERHGLGAGAGPVVGAMSAGMDKLAGAATA
jgi:uncharacterized protein (DUF302 family)